MDIKKIVCLGAGFAGGSTMATIAYKCPSIQVTVLDVDHHKIQSWNQEELPVFEPLLNEVVQQTRNRNLFFSTSMQTPILEADAIFVAVNTPSKKSGQGANKACDLSFFESAVRSVAQILQTFKGHKIIVEKSTVPVKTAEMVEEILESNCPDLSFHVVSNPEFLAQGTAVNDLLHPDRVLIGGKNSSAVEALVNVYTQWVPKSKIITTDVWSSELAKLCCNAMLAQRISSINSISAICEKTGAKVNEVAQVLASDPRIGSSYLKTGVGFGGSCLAKDTLCLVYISEFLGLHEVASYWSSVIEMNNFQINRFSNLIIQVMNNTLKEKHITILGFSYKKNTSDARESAAIHVCNSLLQEGATLHIYDPKVSRQAILKEMNERNFLDFVSAGKQMLTFEDPHEAAKGTCAVVVLTEWEEFKQLDYQAMHRTMQRPCFLFDGRNILDHFLMRTIGFKVFAIGNAS